MNSDTIMGMVVMPIFFGFLAFIFKLIWDGKKVKLKSILHHKLVDKFASAAELNEFLQSDGGGNFLKSLTIDGLNPKEKLLGAISKGIILSFLGIAFFLMSGIVPDDHQVMMVLGVLVVSLGVGYLVSSAVSYNLSKKWGIIEEK